MYMKDVFTYIQYFTIRAIRLWSFALKFYFVLFFSFALVSFSISFDIDEIIFAIWCLLFTYSSHIISNFRKVHSHSAFGIQSRNRNRFISTFLQKAKIPLSKHIHRCIWLFISQCAFPSLHFAPCRTIFIVTVFNV